MADFKNLLEILGLNDESLNNFVEPNTEMEEGEVVVGEMTDTEKTCLTFSEKKKIEHDALIDEVNARDGKPTNDDLCKKEQLKGEANLGTDLMWASIRKRFPLSDECDSFGVRKGFKVVSFKSKPKVSMVEFPFGFMISIKD